MSKQQHFQPKRVTSRVEMQPRRDMFSRKKRSEIMSRIRSKNTKLDLAMARLLKEAKIPYEMYPGIEGKPDFLVGRRAVVFCDSSFWHGRNWSSLRQQLMSGNNPSYWVKHIERNRRRDREVSRKLASQGYYVVRLWDSSISKHPSQCLRKVGNALRRSEQAFSSG